MRASIVILLGAAVVAGCSAGTTDFRDVAEQRIVDVLGDGGKADCEEPRDTAVGTTFACTGTDASGRRSSYTAEITKREEVTVRPDG